MKNLILFLLVLVFALGGYFVYDYFQKGGPQDLEFVRLSNIKLSDFKLPPTMSVVFGAEMLLNNPNPFGVTVEKMEFDVWVDDKQATRIEQNVSNKIPANAEFSVPLEFVIPLKNNALFKNIKNVISGAWKKQALDIRAEGYIYVNAIGTSLKIPFDYSETHQLKDYLK